MDKRLIRIEKLLADALAKIQPDKAKRMTEKQVIEAHGVSKHVLRRLRLGYKRSDGLDIPPALFKWRHITGRNFDYDRKEIEQVLRQSATGELNKNIIN